MREEVQKEKKPKRVAAGKKGAEARKLKKETKLNESITMKEPTNFEKKRFLKINFSIKNIY